MAENDWEFWPRYYHLHFKTPLPPRVQLNTAYRLECVLTNELDMFRGMSKRTFDGRKGYPLAVTSLMLSCLLLAFCAGRQ
jgi:hypothetical protein